MVNTRNLTIIPVAVVALVLAGCSSSTETEAPGDDTGTYFVNDCALRSTAVEQVGAPVGQVIDGIVIGGDDVPVISVGPDSQPASELLVTDLRPGNGPSAALGDTITVNYCGIGQSTGSLFDSSWANGQPATFPVVQGGLIQGWIDGVTGMQVGERRLLIIPSELGYGNQAVGSILPNETLIFVVELVSIDS